MSEVVGYVALGSNVGDREAHLRAGLAGMAEAGIAPRRRSSIWETEPVDTGDPSWFLNMVVEIRSSRAPLDVLERLQGIERQAGRGPVATRNAPRVLDLDLLVLGDASADDPRLTLPHPRMWARRFVLSPLAEIAPGLREPATGRTVQEVLDDFDDGYEVRRVGAVAAAAAGPV